MEKSISDYKSEFERALRTLESLVDEAFEAYCEEYDDPRHPQYLTYFQVHWSQWSVYVKIQSLNGMLLHPNTERATKLALAFDERLMRLRDAITQGDQFGCEAALYKLREIAEF